MTDGANARVGREFYGGIGGTLPDSGMRHAQPQHQFYRGAYVYKFNCFRMYSGWPRKDLRRIG